MSQHLLNLLVTGGTGFLGKPTVEAALARGHRVRLVVRPGADAAQYASWTERGVTLARVDLRTRAGLTEALAGIDCVLHLAASKAGDMYAQYGGTVISTENLLWAMEQAGVARIVNISSFAVYDYAGMRSGSTLTERSPLAATIPPRDEYSHTKLVQEQLVQAATTQRGMRSVNIRPGVIYGADNWWTARLGASHSAKRWVRIGWRAMLPVTYVGNCAEAIVLGAERTTTLAAGTMLTVNLLDEEVRQGVYAREVQRRLPSKPKNTVIPWTVMRLVAWGAMTFNKVALGGRAKLPAVLVPARLHARFKPLRYSNAAARKELGYSPRLSLAEALDATFAAPASRKHTG